MTEPTLVDHAFVGVLAAVVLYALLVSRKQLRKVTFDTPTKVSFYLTNGVVLWIGAIAACVVWKLAGRTLGDLGLTWRQDSVGLGLLITATFVVAFSLETWRMAATAKRREELLAHWRRHAPFLPETPREMTHFSYMSLTAGVTEEIIVRGYLILYVSAFTGPTALGMAAAVGLPSVAFAVAHLYQGWRATGRILLLAIAFGAIFVVTGSLLIPIVLHTLVDLGVGLLAFGLAQRRVPEPA